MYPLLNKIPGNKRTATPEPDEEEQDKDFLPDPSTRPDVPVKQFEEGDVHARGWCITMLTQDFIQSKPVVYEIKTATLAGITASNS